jgi:hypothetical protein
MILNFIYLYGFNLKIVFGLIALLGLGIFFRFREHCRVCHLYLLMAAGLFLSYFLTRRLPFSFLISYERNDYAGRVLLVAALFLLPFIILALYGFIEKLKKQNRFFIASFSVFGVLLIAASLYLSYPRIDNYHNSRGYSTGQSDISAVRWIAADAGSAEYIVLANQQVSAAALREFGFKKYYEIAPTTSPLSPLLTRRGVAPLAAGRGEVFYYPIPTSSPLYQYYLDMVYKEPSRQTALAAMDLVGADTAYFVLNKYWWAFPKILNEAKLAADSFTTLDNNEVFVFKYTRSK